MSKLAVYDPPMCCATGVCGPSIDPGLARFAADLDWLRARGVTVERYNMAQEVAAFTDDPVVSERLFAGAVLPFVVVDGKIVREATYPTRAALAAWAGVTP